MSRLLTLLVLAGAVFGQGPSFTKTTHTYKTVGDLAIEADVYRPPDQTIRPVVFWIHGGALIMGQRGAIRPAQLERYIKAGFAVVSIDYRLAPETKLPEILEDVSDAYRWVREQGPSLFRIDPNRIGVVGHSAGGYLTLTTGHRVRPRPRALVAFYGYGDIAADWYSKPDPFYSKQPAVPKGEAYGVVGGPPIAGTYGPNQRGRFYLYCRQNGLWPKEVAGLDPQTQPEAFNPFCPVRNVKQDYPPTMLLHGDADTDVPFSQSEQMSKELTRQGIYHEFIKIPGGRHGFDSAMDDPGVSQIFDRAVAFLKRHLN